MSDTAKKLNQSPESYSPKMPEIASMMKQAEINTKKIHPQYSINTVFSTGNNPWIGGCNYLCCFISMQMYIDKMPYEQQSGIRYGLYRKYFAVTGMGLSTIWQPEAGWDNFSFEATHDFIRKTFHFTGYDFVEIQYNSKNEEDLNKIIAQSIYENKSL